MTHCKSDKRERRRKKQKPGTRQPFSVRNVSSGPPGAVELQLHFHSFQLVELRHQLLIGWATAWRGCRGGRCSSERCLCTLMMDLMRWSLIASPPSSLWPGGLQDGSETLALTAALGCSLLAGHTGRLSYCFHTVSIYSGLHHPCWKAGLCERWLTEGRKVGLDEDELLNSFWLGSATRSAFWVRVKTISGEETQQCSQVMGFHLPLTASLSCCPTELIEHLKKMCCC